MNTQPRHPVAVTPMTPQQQKDLKALHQFHGEPRPLGELLEIAAERFVLPCGTFDARAFLDHLNAQP